MVMKKLSTPLLGTYSFLKKKSALPLHRISEKCGLNLSEDLKEKLGLCFNLGGHNSNYTNIFQ